MSRKSYPNVNAANQYARDVVRGKIVACQYVIDACQRHIDDIAQEKGRKFRYRFDKDLAEQAAKFIQLLPHTKGNGHLSECLSHWSHGNYLSYAVHLAGYKKGRSLGVSVKFIPKYPVKW